MTMTSNGWDIRVGATVALALGLLGIGCGDDQAGVPGSDSPLNAAAQAANGRNNIRPLAPLSGSMSGSRQPTFRYTPAGSATVDLCDDRACAHVVDAIAGSQGSAQPATPLRAGVLFWRVVSGQTISAVWQLTIPGRDTGGDIAWGVVPDFNGDGLADVAIGSPQAGSQTVSVFNGQPGSSPGFTPDETLTGGALFGEAVAAAGDVNGDGFVDLAVAAGSNPGSVTVFLGGPAGPAAAGTTLRPGAVTSGFGATIASAGDVNGDGYADLLVGGVQHAQIFLGGPTGIARSASLRLAGSTANSLTGDASTVQGPSDVNGDGMPDLFVGGALYLSSAGGLLAQPGFAAGTLGFAGDENGDGFGDFGGVFAGTPDGIDKSQVLFSQAGETALGTAGDIDGDGYSDIISSLSSMEGFPDRQRVYLGGPGSCGSTGCRTHLGIPIPGHDFVDGDLTAFLGGVGDVNGDGTDDLVASTPDTGQAYFFNSLDYVLTPGADNEAFAFPTWTFSPGFGASFAALFGSVLPLQ
ncbi:MAG TPA: VCBS repeat-containing protein [Polyangia bacterium]|nr:VCBS repeat-containing protein [Polyangia bacterium]